MKGQCFKGKTQRERIINYTVNQHFIMPQANSSQNVHDASGMCTYSESEKCTSHFMQVRVTSQVSELQSYILMPNL